MNPIPSTNEKILTAVFPHWWGSRDFIHINSEKAGETHNIHIQVFNQSLLARQLAFLISFFRRIPPESQLESYYGKPVYENTIVHVSEDVLETTKIELKARLEMLLKQRKVLENKNKDIEKTLISLAKTSSSHPIASNPTPQACTQIAPTEKESPPASFIKTETPKASLDQNIPGASQPSTDTLTLSNSDRLQTPQNSTEVDQFETIEPTHSQNKPVYSDYVTDFPDDSFENTLKDTFDTLNHPDSHEGIEILKKKTEDLLQEVEAEQTHLEDSLHLNETIQKTEAAALEALKNLPSTDTSIPIDEQESPAKELLKQNKLSTKFIETIRCNDQTTSPVEQADKILEKLKAAGFSQEIQNLIINWIERAADCVTSLDGHETLEPLIATVCSKCKKEIQNKIDAAGQSLLNTAVNKKPAQAWQTTYETLRKQVFAERSKAWATLSKKAEDSLENFESILSLKKQVLQETSVDEELEAILSITPERSCLKILQGQPSELTFGNVMFHAAKEISKNARNLLQAVTLDDQEFLESKFIILEKDKNITVEDIHTVVGELLSASSKWIQNQNLSKDSKGELFKICQTIQSLDASLDAILNAHNASREKYIKKAGGGMESLLAISNHPSIVALFEEHIKSALWSTQTNLSEIQNDEKNWTNLVEHSKKVRNCLKSLALTQNAFAKSLDTANNFIKANSDDINLNSEILTKLQTRIDAYPINSDSFLKIEDISRYESIIKGMNSHLSKLIDNAHSGSSTRDGIFLQIDNFLNEIDIYRTKLESIEKNYHVYLSDAHDLLDKQKLAVEALKESSLLPTWRLLPDWQCLRKDTKLKELDNAKLKVYQRAVKTVIENARISLSSITQVNDKYSIFENHSKKIEERIAELNAQGLTSHAAKLETNFKNIKEKHKPALEEGEIAAREPSLPNLLKQVHTDTTRLKLLLNKFNENMRKTELLRNKILAEINGFHQYIETNRKNLQTIESYYQIDLRPIHDLLDSSQEKANGFKESIKIRSDWLIFKNKKNLPELDSSELKDYQRAVHNEILDMRNYLNNTANIPKAYSKHEEFLKLCTEADLRIKTLQAAKPKQLLHAMELENQLKALKDTHSMTWINLQTLTRAIYPAATHFFNGMTFNPINNTIIGTRKLVRPIENLIWGTLMSGIHTAKLKGFIAQSKRKKAMSIPDQLAACKFNILPRILNFPLIRGEVEQDLRNEFLRDVNKQIETCEQKLQAHSTLLETVIAQYVAPNSKWFHTMDACINDKMGEIVTCKDKLVIPRIQLPYKFSLWASEYNVQDLSPSRMQQYEKRVYLLTKNLIKNLNDETHIYVIGEYHKKLTDSIVAARALSETLRKKGHLTGSKRLNDLCDNVKKRIEESKNSIKNLAQMKTLGNKLISLSNEINAAIRMNKPLANKSASAMEQLLSLNSLESPEAIELHKLAVEVIRQNIDNFIKKLADSDKLIKTLDQNNHLDFEWREKLVNFIDSYRTEIAPYASGLKVVKVGPPTLLGSTILGSTFSLQPSRVEQCINLEDLSIPQLNIYDFTVANITAEKINGVVNPRYRIAEFENKTNLDAFVKAMNSFQTELANTEAFLATGFNDKLPKTKIREEGIKSLNILVTHVQNVHDRITHKISCVYEMKECIKFLNKAKEMLQAGVKSIQSNKQVNLGSWANMKALESLDRRLTDHPDYHTNLNENIIGHRHLRNKILTGVNETSEKRFHAAKKAAKEATSIGAKDIYQSSDPAVQAGGLEVDEAEEAQLPASEIGAIAGAATANYAIIHNLDDNTLIASIARSAGEAVAAQADGTPNIATRVAGLAVGKALKDRGDSVEKIFKGAAAGAAYYASLAIHDNAQPLVAAVAAGLAAASAARAFGAPQDALRTVAAAAAGRAAISQTKRVAVAQPGAAAVAGAALPPPVPLQTLINNASDGAARMIRELGGSVGEIREAAALAAGAAAASEERAREGHTLMSISAHAATAAAIKAAQDIPVPQGGQALPLINRDAVYNAALEAATAASARPGFKPNDIATAATESAVRVAAPILPNNPVGIGCIQGNLIRVRSWLGTYIQQIDAALAAPALAQEKRNQLTALRANIVNSHYPLINRMLSGLPQSNKTILTHPLIIEYNQLMRYGEESMRAYVKVRSNTEDSIAQINAGMEARPILALHPLDPNLAWNFIE